MTRDEYYDALEHSAFKYIDKWKSKAGNWVYQYTKGSNDVSSLDRTPTADDVKKAKMKYAQYVNETGQRLQALNNRKAAGQSVNEHTLKWTNEGFNNLKYHSEQAGKKLAEMNLSEYQKANAGKLEVAKNFVKKLFGR